MASLNIKLNGRWLDQYGDWGHPIVTWRWPYGSWELSWNMQQTTRTTLQTGMLQPTRLQVDAYIDGIPVWAGNLPIADPAINEDATTYTAIGVAREAEEAAALTSNHKTTSVPRTAASEAIGRGVLTWGNVTALSNQSYVAPDTTPDDDTDETEAINYLGALLDAWSQSENLRWALTPLRDTIVAPDPTKPEFRIDPNVAALGVTSEKAVGRMFARYNNSGANGELSTEIIGVGWPEKILDLTDQGAMSRSQVEQKLDSIQKRYSRTLVGWKNGFTVTDGQVTTMGGVPTHLGLLGAKVARGLMIQIVGQHDPRFPGYYNTDAVVGEAIWNESESTLQLSPVDSMEDTFETALQNQNVNLLT